MQHQNNLGVEGYADVDHPLACKWLQDNNSSILVHGHTHKPADHIMQSDDFQLERKVLSDWDFNTATPRADALRLHKQESQRNWNFKRILLAQ